MGFLEKLRERRETRLAKKNERTSQVNVCGLESRGMMARSGARLHVPGTPQYRKVKLELGICSLKGKMGVRDEGAGGADG